MIFFMFQSAISEVSTTVHLFMLFCDKSNENSVNSPKLQSSKQHPMESLLSDKVFVPTLDAVNHSSKPDFWFDSEVSSYSPV